MRADIFETLDRRSRRIKQVEEALSWGHWRIRALNLKLNELLGKAWVQVRAYEKARVTEPLRKALIDSLGPYEPHELLTMGEAELIAFIKERNGRVTRRLLIQEGIIDH